MSYAAWPILANITKWTFIAATSTILFISASLASLCLYRLFLHPLASLPGPRFAAASDLWHASKARNGQMFSLGRTIHKKYGHVVRVGPNEVWFDSQEAFKAIYRKSSLYGVERQTMNKASVLFTNGCRCWKRI